MTKFYVGQKVLVKSDTYCPCPGATSFIGDIGVIAHIGELDISVWNEKKKDWFNFSPRDLEPITETPKEITVNGVTYVRKPNREHEWKFGDVAVHEKYGVGIVTDTGVRLEFTYENGKNLKYLHRSELTFIRRTDLSV